MREKRARGFGGRLPPLFLSAGCSRLGRQPVLVWLPVASVSVLLQTATLLLRYCPRLSAQVQAHLLLLRSSRLPRLKALPRCLRPPVAASSDASTVRAHSPASRQEVRVECCLRTALKRPSRPQIEPRRPLPLRGKRPHSCALSDTVLVQIVESKGYFVGRRRHLHLNHGRWPLQGSDEEPLQDRALRAVWACAHMHTLHR